jgi:predicted ATP-grasp superfamily ATP-dependent carboligase
LPLIGNGAAALRRLRDAQVFFGVLDAHGVAHPPVRFDWPDDASGWLLKDFAGSGGAQVQCAPGLPRHALSATQVLQQERHGATPMSATFIADGRRACVLGCNRQLTRATRERPFVWCGVIGPVPVSAGMAASVDAALQALVPAFGLRGLGSLDVLAFDDAERIEVLEVNPRVPASAQLYAAAGVRVIEAHVQACEHAVLPGAPTAIAPRGVAVVFAPRELQSSDAAAGWLATQPDVHDTPAQATHFRAGDPVCSVSAVGADAAAVQAHLTQRTQALLAALENLE